jgi:hypothetical protein
MVRNEVTSLTLLLSLLMFQLSMDMCGHCSSTLDGSQNEALNSEAGISIEVGRAEEVFCLPFRTAAAREP